MCLSRKHIAFYTKEKHTNYIYNILQHCLATRSILQSCFFRVTSSCQSVEKGIDATSPKGTCPFYQFRSQASAGWGLNGRQTTRGATAKISVQCILLFYPALAEVSKFFCRAPPSKPFSKQNPDHLIARHCNNKDPSLFSTSRKTGSCSRTSCPSLLVFL